MLHRLLFFILFLSAVSFIALPVLRAQATYKVTVDGESYELSLPRGEESSPSEGGKIQVKDREGNVIGSLRVAGRRNIEVYDVDDELIGTATTINPGALELLSAQEE